MKKPAPINQATKRELYQIVLPLAIGRSLHAVSSKDIYRDVLLNKVCVEHANDKTTLVATDTRTMMVAIAPILLDIPAGNYEHEITPASFNGEGRLLLSKFDASFPNWKKIEATCEKRKPAGSLKTDTGRLMSCEPVCIDYRRFAPLCPGYYEMFMVDCSEPERRPYVFTCKYNDWSLTYMIMPMERHD